ncbi:surfactin synthase thioesterase subunit [Lentzea atacamensis]|uniref:Surfactin synthase thioesterase subunit n=1 Tax=Lentzea atacamensis TaxID=531938 RepID=A0ABX9DVV9_9PSEU|nr:surfactin synthase thioesterase subunit [Lentzea atacamensis]
MRFLPRRPDQTRTLVCFPWSGAGPSWFGRWAADMPHVELLAVVLPGRGGRRAEGLEHRFEVIARQITAALTTYRVTQPIAFLGHSLGALLAYQVALNLQRQGIVVDALVASGSRAPAVPPVVELHKLDDTRLFEQLQHLGGLVDGQHHGEDWRQRFLDRTRADLTACETFSPRDAAPLSCHVTTWAGTTDWYAPPAAVRQWAAVSARPVQHQMFDGDHFFIRNLNAEVLLNTLGWTAPHQDAA